MPDDHTSESPIQNPEIWVDQYGDYLYRFAIAKVKDAATAEDLVQETFLAALKSRQNFQRRSAARTWLTAILKHKIVDYYRKKSRERVVEDIESIEAMVDGFFHDTGKWRVKPAKWITNPMKSYEQQEFFKTLYGCLAKMPKRLAQAFILREMEGYSTEELCKTMEISSTNSWVMLYRARAHLRQCLELNWFEKEAVKEQ